VVRRNLVWQVYLKDDTNFTLVSVRDTNKQASSPETDKPQYGYLVNNFAKAVEYSHKVTGFATALQIHGYSK